MVAKANLLRRKREAGLLPGTGRPVTWATLEGATDGDTPEPVSQRP